MKKIYILHEEIFEYFFENQSISCSDVARLVPKMCVPVMLSMIKFEYCACVPNGTVTAMQNKTRKSNH